LDEYRGLAQVLDLGDYFSLLKATAVSAPEILRTGKLTSVDAAMSRNMKVCFGEARLTMPLADIDAILKAHSDNPTFGNVREIYARNCYLHGLRLPAPQRTVLDLGANRGMFSILALVALQAELVVGVEPNSLYSSVFARLLEVNHCSPLRAPRYTRFISSASVEQKDPTRNVSIQTILREQKIDRFNLVKMDIEGHEIGVFSEPEWLEYVDTITMELHPREGDMSPIPRALKDYGFEYVHQDQSGNPVAINSAMFLFASRTGVLASRS
jgi:hypothetical protein